LSKFYDDSPVFTAFFLDFLLFAIAALIFGDGADGTLNSCNLSVNPLITLSVFLELIFLTPSRSSVCQSVVTNTPVYPLEFDANVVFITCPRFVSFFLPKALCLVKPSFLAYAVTELKYSVFHHRR
jgi:hypothetical protein